MKAAGQPGRQADQQQRAQPADPRRMHDHYDAVMLVVACNLELAGGLLHNGAATHVVMASTHERALEIVPLAVLKEHAVDVPADPGALGN